MKRSAVILFIVLASVGARAHFASAAICASDKTPLLIISRDSEGGLQPSINYKVFSQRTNPDGGFYFSSETLASGKTDAGGQSDVVCLPTTKSPYAVKLYEYNESYGYFSLFSADLKSEGSLLIAEASMSSLRVVFRDAEGKLLKNVRFDVYVQSFDVDGNPIIDETKLNVDKLVRADFTTGDAGGVSAFLAAGNYAVRVHGTGTASYFYIWNQAVTANAVTPLDYKLGTIRFIVEDGLGGLVKNYAVSLYQQDQDVRGKPILGSLVAANLSTGSTGKVDAYLPTGTYAAKIPATYASTAYIKYNLKALDQQLSTTTYRLSGFRVIMRDDAGSLVRNAKFSIATQKLDALGRPVVNTTVLKDQQTGEAGFVDLYLTPGTYVLLYGSKRLYQLDVSENQFTKVDWPRQVSFQPRAEVSLTNPFGNSGLSIRPRSTPGRIGVKKFRKTVSRAYRVTAQSITKAYTVTFYYTDDQLRSKGVTEGKLRVAFYNERTKRWGYVGRVLTSQNQAKATLKDAGTLLLIAQR
jgi:hypothetical protein